ncbi:hypothetical protein WA026_019299 [Henosepilachna vigintioctopunctata]|uniref:Uncharacterized protein n=1 Tax=Henosepilachna vigintioctopunctata TaxID=420089 RepID=A0AAW1UAI4_9CUCU
MQLRYLHVRGISRVMSQIDNLLSKIVYGEEECAVLMEEQQKIVQFCDDALATSIRIEFPGQFDGVGTIPGEDTEVGSISQVISRAELSSTNEDIDALEASQKQLKGCLSPSDIKTVDQKIWVLKNQRTELDHELLMLCHEIEDKLGQRFKFESMQQKFMEWADYLEKKVKDHD